MCYAFVLATTCFSTRSHSFYIFSLFAPGKVCLLELDVQGAESIKRSDLNAHFLFISPPSLEQLEERLRGRGTESEEQVRVRLGGAHREMSYLQRDDGFFDAVVVNDEFEVSYASLLDTLAQFYPDLLPASE